MARDSDTTGATRSRRYRERVRDGELVLGTLSVPARVVERLLDDRWLTDADSFDREKILAAVGAMLKSWAAGRSASAFFRHARHDVPPAPPARSYDAAPVAGKAPDEA
jgi:hypothetical protein